MPRFFTETINNTTATITGQDAAHIAKVLRMKPGEQLTLCDLKGTDYECEIESITPELITLNILEQHSCITEPSVQITLYQAMPKSDKFEFIVQKAVELGVTKIVPILTSRCISRPDEKSMHKKLGRYNKIAFEAAKQSGRGIIPIVSELISFDETLKQLQAYDLSILFYERSKTPLKQILTNNAKTIAVIVGSEGGFDESEAEEAIAQNIHIASLGTRILRCETAPIAGLSAILYHTDNF